MPMLPAPLRRLFKVLTSALFLFLAIAAVAQETGVSGTVRDSSGSVLAGAAITVKNVNTGEVRQATSNDVGHYTVPNLRAGVFDVSAEKQGFKRQLIEHVTLEVQSIRTVDLTLPVGSVSDQVNVTAAATAVQTSDSTVSTLFETKLVNELPLNGRNFLQLQLLSPGVTLGRGGT